MKHQVFISYSHKDSDQAKKLVEQLEAQGIKCWIGSRDVAPGSNISRDIPKAIEEAPFFLTMLSDQYLKSAYTSNELVYALSKHKNIIPVQTDGTNLTDQVNFLPFDTQIQNYHEEPQAVADKIAEQIKQFEPQLPQIQQTPIVDKPVIYHVFVSHSTADDDIADEIVTHLENKNIACWIAPRDTRSHTTFPAQITQAVRDCPVFLLLVSRQAMNSAHVEREISLAIDKKISPGYKYIIPLMLDDLELTDEFCYYLANLHYYAYYQDPQGVRDKITEQITQFIAQEQASESRYLNEAQELYQAGRYREAVQYYHKAARLGNASAQTMLGYCHHTGKTGSRNIEEAMKWYKLAADQGNASAQANLALCYAYERSIENDENAAFQLFRQAANQGHTGAQMHLGNCYENGIGVDRDLSEAVRWYKASAQHGNTYAEKKLAQLKAK